MKTYTSLTGLVDKGNIKLSLAHDMGIEDNDDLVYYASPELMEDGLLICQMSNGRLLHLKCVYDNFKENINNLNLEG